MEERVGRARMTVGLLGPALVASIFAGVFAYGGVIQSTGPVDTILAAAFVGFFVWVAQRDFHRWRREITR